MNVWFCEPPKAFVLVSALYPNAIGWACTSVMMPQWPASLTWTCSNRSLWNMCKPGNVHVTVPQWPVSFTWTCSNRSLNNWCMPGNPHITVPQCDDESVTSIDDLNMQQRPRRQVHQTAAVGVWVLLCGRTHCSFPANDPRIKTIHKTVEPMQN